MKASELRIDNIVLFEKKKRPQRITMVKDTEAIGLMPHDEYVRITDIKPIPLTEKWLVKFGLKKIVNKKSDDTVWEFENDGTTYHLIINEHLSASLPSCGYIGVYDDHLIAIDDGDNVIEKEGDEWTGFIWSIKYVHTFQNIYFALTGEEL